MPPQLSTTAKEHHELWDSLNAQVSDNATEYIKNLVSAEAAVLRGQFNLAKVLRASAHAQRVLAMEAARLSGDTFSSEDILQRNLTALTRGPERADRMQGELDREVRNKLNRTALVRERAQDLILRSMKSLKTNPDVMESDVAQSLWGCYNCGYIAEGGRPAACIVCGALEAEFQWFGPFYSATPEHLGQLTPAQIVTILEAVPKQVADIIAGADDEILSHKPSEKDWCVKEIVGHMLETDILFARRATTLLQEKGMPDLSTPIPPWKLHEDKGYEHMPTHELMQRLNQTRLASLAIVRAIKPEQWSRRGTNSDTSTSMLDFGTWLANHDLGHTAQIRRLCQK
jgi:rubrerythrin